MKTIYNICTYIIQTLANSYDTSNISALTFNDPSHKCVWLCIKVQRRYEIDKDIFRNEQDTTPKQIQCKQDVLIMITDIIFMMDCLNLHQSNYNAISQVWYIMMIYSSHFISIWIFRISDIIIMFSKTYLSCILCYI